MCARVLHKTVNSENLFVVAFEIWFYFATGGDGDNINLFKVCVLVKISVNKIPFRLDHSKIILYSFVCCWLFFPGQFVYASNAFDSGSNFK